MAVDVGRLVQAMRRHFVPSLQTGGALSREVGEEARAVLAAIPEDASAILEASAEAHPVLRHIETWLAAGADPLEGGFAPVAGALPWRYSYAPRVDAPGLETRMAWAEIVGPAAPILNDRVGFGLTFIASDTHYLSHRHPAVELYNVVSGHARWQAGGQAAIMPPGSFVLHPANIVHAMRTADQPLLAIYSWSGDIVSPTAWV